MPIFFTHVSSSNVSSHSIFSVVGSLIDHLAQNTNAENHDQQTDGDNDEQSEAEPTENHCGSTDTRADSTVTEILGNNRRSDGCSVLPKYRDQHEDGGDEDDGQRNLGNGTRGEGLDFAVGALGILLLMPAWEGGEQKEADEGEDDGDDAG